MPLLARPWLTSLAFMAVCLAGCGGQKPPSDATATPAAPVAPAPSAAAAAAAPTEAASTPPAPPPTETTATPPASAPEPVVPLAERLVAPSVAFMIRYDDSAPKQAAEAVCAKGPDDPEVHVKCMEKERGKFLADVLVFRKTESALSLTVYRRQGNALQELSKSAIAFTEETPNRVKVKVTSDKGTRPLFAGKKELSIATPEDSTSNVELDDPRFGKLIYEARIGLVNDAG